MSTKIKLILIISFFLVLILLIIALMYLSIFTKKNGQVIKTATIVEKLNEENKTLEDDITVVILNEYEDKLKKTVEQSDKEENYEEKDTEITSETNNEVNLTERQENENVEDFYIKVNYEANVVTIYTKDLNGDYTVAYKAFTCSTGTATPTSGTYKIDYKYRWLGLFGNVYGQYCTRIVGNILFHSVPYLEKENPESLEYWEYDKLRNFCFCRMHKANS